MNAVRLNVLEDVRIASPCPMRWEDMTGGERVRHCDQCDLNVFNLSDMSREEAEGLVRSHQGGRMCVGFYRRADGTILTRDCPVGLRALRDRVVKVWTRIAAMVALVLTGSTMLSARAAQGNSRSLAGLSPFAKIGEWVGISRPSPTVWIAGAMCPPPLPPPSGGAQ